MHVPAGNADVWVLATDVWAAVVREVLGSPCVVVVGVVVVVASETEIETPVELSSAVCTVEVSGIKTAGATGSSVVTSVTSFISVVAGCDMIRDVLP